MFDFKDFNFEKEIEKIKKFEGYERGSDLIFLISYLKKRQGEEKYQQLKDFLAVYQIELPEEKEIIKMEWISISLTTALILGSVKFFDWSKQEVIEMGRAAVSLNFTVKFFIKYFTSPEKTLKKAAANWNKYFSFGKIEIFEYNKQARKIIVRLRNFNRHKIICFYFIGVFERIIQSAVGSKQITGQERKCSLEGDAYHEYVFKW